MLTLSVPYGLALALGLAPLLAKAELGGRVESFSSGSMIAVSRSIEARPGYAIRTTVLGTGTRINEYVKAGTASAGVDATESIVFAVTWNGPFLPELSVLLGSHFDRLTAESSARPRAGRPGLTVDQPEVVIRSSGRMRAFEGRAWLPAALPPGFDPHELD